MGYEIEDILDARKLGIPIEEYIKTKNKPISNNDCFTPSEEMVEIKNSDDFSLSENNNVNLSHVVILTSENEKENIEVPEILKLNNENHTPTSLQIDSAKDKIITSTKLEDMVNNIRYFNKQMNYSFFFTAHCFLKIHNERIYKQKGYDNFGDFVKVELNDFSSKQVYNFINVAETFSLEQITTEILDLGVTKLICITTIKDKQLRMPFLLNNFEEIQKISSRELKLRTMQLNSTQVQNALPANFDIIVKNHLVELKDNVLKLSSFLEEFEELKEEKDFELLRSEIEEMENKLKKVKDNIINKLPK